MKTFLQEVNAPTLRRYCFSYKPIISSAEYRKEAIIYSASVDVALKEFHNTIGGIVYFIYSEPIG